MKNRWDNLDLFKFIAVLSLIFTHTLIWWVSPDDKSLSGFSSEYNEYIVGYLFLWSFIPIILPLSAGISIRYMLEQYQNDFSQINLLKFFKRGGMLYSLGLLMNLLAWDNIEEIWTWDVLNLVGVSTILIPIILKYSKNIGLLFFGIITLIATYYIKNLDPSFFPYQLKRILIGTGDGNNFWPFLPWFFIIVLGYFIGDLKIKKNLFFNKIIFSITTITLLSSYVIKPSFPLLIIEQSNIWGPKLMEPPIDSLINHLCISLILFTLFSYIKIKNLSKMTYHFSKNILWIYLIHTVLMKNICDLLYRYIKFDWGAYFIICLIQIIIIFLLITIRKKIKR